MTERVIAHACGPQQYERCNDGGEHDWSGPPIPIDGGGEQSSCAKCGLGAFEADTWMIWGGDDAD